MSSSQFFTLDGKQIEYRWVGPPPDEAPVLVFLHEGLGCAASGAISPRGWRQQQAVRRLFIAAGAMAVPLLAPCRVRYATCTMRR